MKRNKTVPKGGDTHMDITTQKKVFDVDSKDDVVLVKKGTFEPVTTQAEALARVGNDASKF